MTNEPNQHESEKTSIWPYVWIYGFFFIAWGVMIPYFNLHLVEKGYSKQFVAFLYSVIPLVSIFAPPLWGYWIDRALNRRITLTVFLCIGAGIFIVFLNASSRPALVLLIGLYAIFITPFIPTMDALTLQNLRPTFATVRSSGTFSFLLTSLFGGALITVIGTGRVLYGVPIAFLLAAIALLQLKDAGAERDRQSGIGPGNFIHVLRMAWHEGLGMFLLFGLIFWMSLMPYLNLFSIFMKEMIDRQGVGNAGTLIGAAWALSTIFELVLFLYSNRLLKRVPIGWLYAAVIIGSILRFVIYAIEPPVWLIFFGQVLHFLNFALFYILGARIVSGLAPAGMRNSFQTLWASLVIGLGGFLGSFFSGLIAGVVPIENVFWFSAAMTVFSTIPLYLFLRGRKIDAEILING